MSSQTLLGFSILAEKSNILLIALLLYVTWNFSLEFLIFFLCSLDTVFDTVLQEGYFFSSSLVGVL